MDKKELDLIRKTNNVRIVGTIKGANNLEPKTSAAGEDYVSGTVVVESYVDGVPSLFEIEVYQKRLTKAGTPSVLFDTYVGLKNKIGQKYDISGSLTESRFYDKRNNQLASSYRIAGKWFNPAKITEVDKAEFEVSGFVYKPLTERKNKEGALICYDLEIGQASFNDDKLSIFKFQVDPSNITVLQGIQGHYAVGSTVKFRGNLSCIVEEKTVTEDGGFGVPKVKVYTNTTKRFWITGGDLPIVDGSQYSLADIQKLKAAYGARDIELSAGAQEMVASGMSAIGTGPVSSRQSSLI